jgi:hypothetical protein
MTVDSDALLCLFFVAATTTMDCPTKETIQKEEERKGEKKSSF